MRSRQLQGEGSARTAGHLLATLLVVAGGSGAALAQPREPGSGVYDDNPLLSFGHLEFDTRESPAIQIPAGWTHDETAAFRQRPDDTLLVQFEGPVGASQRGLLSEDGFEILAYVPYNAFLVRDTRAALGALPSESRANGLPGVRWTGRFEPYFKIGPHIARFLAGDDPEEISGGPDWGIRFNVTLVDGVEPDELRGYLQSLQGLELLPTRGPIRVRVQGRRSARAIEELLRQIAAQPQVLAVETWRPAHLVNDENAQSGQSGQCVDNNANEGQNTTIFNQGLSGWGSRLAVADSCTDADEGWFYDISLARLPAHEPSSPWSSVAPDWDQRKIVEYYDMYSGDTTLGCGGASGCVFSCPDHGTHVTGTMGGNCNLDAEGLATQTDPANSAGDNDGMAPGAFLIVQDLGNGTLDYLNVDGGTLGELVSVAYENTCDGSDCGIDAHNNSWGASTDTYNTDARTGDRELWELKDLLVLVAMGNAGSGLGTVGAPATAKNVVSVGSAQNCSTQNMVSSSSRGDTADGRLKPTVVATGASVTSARNDGSVTNSNGDCSTLTIGGTSMATPTITGFSGLLHQYFQDGFYPSGAANAAEGFNPSGPLMKAMLVNTARPMSGSGSDQEGVGWPNMDQGYGYAVMDDALFFSGDSRRLWFWNEPLGIDASGAGQGSSMTFTRTVTDGTQTLKITLVWYDTEAFTSCSPCLNNDLDLSVTVGATTYTVTRIAGGSAGHLFPRTVVPASPGAGQTTTANGPDTANTVEQIVLYNVPDSTSLDITVTASSTPDGPIPFALVVTGGIDACASLPEAPTGVEANTPAAGQIEVSWTASTSAGVTEYRVYRATSAGGPYALIGSVASTTTSFLDTSVQVGLDYYYVVRSVIDCESFDSNEVRMSSFGDCTATPTFGGLESLQFLGASQPCGVLLEWSEGESQCGDLVYNVYRATASGGPYSLVQSCVGGTSATDASIALDTDYFWVVTAEDSTSGHGGACNGGNETAPGLERHARINSSAPEILYTNDFETDASDWSPVIFGGSDDSWQGVQTCPAAGSDDILRFGGPSSCTDDHSNNNFAAREPNSRRGLFVPDGATGARLDFQHRWDFEERNSSSAFDGAALLLSLDGSTYFLVASSTFLAGPAYGHTIASTGRVCPPAGSGGLPVWSDTQSSDVSQAVDLDAACDDICTGSGPPAACSAYTSGCQGLTVFPAWVAITDCGVVMDGWFLDDVEVTAEVSCSATAPNPLETLTALCKDSQVTLEWQNPSSGAYGFTEIRSRTDSFPISPSDGGLVVAQNDGLGGQGEFTDSGLANGAPVSYSGFVNDGGAGGGIFSTRTTVIGEPMDTSGPLKWSFFTQEAALAPPIRMWGGGDVFAPSNTRRVYGMQAGTGAAGGTWPAGFSPPAMNGPAQQRAAAFPVAVGSASKTLLLGSQDGHVYCFDAATGDGCPGWNGPDGNPGTSDDGASVEDFGIIQATPMLAARDFGYTGAKDLVLVGTRNASPAANELVAIDLADGTTEWRFDNGGGTSAIGIIAAPAFVDIPGARAVFTSRAHSTGSTNTLWAVDFDDTSATLAWGHALGDIDSAVTRNHSSRDLVVGTNASKIYVLDPATGAVRSGWPRSFVDGPVKHFVRYDNHTDRYLFATTNTAWSIPASGVTGSDWFVALHSPSRLLDLFLSGKVYAGACATAACVDGLLVELDSADAWTTIKTVLVPGAGGLGPVVFDRAQDPDVLHVGSQSGGIHTFEVPLP